jgi:acetylornithine deacetylase/succinyl-diaminopimelate desuccinylase-like protein
MLRYALLALALPALAHAQEPLDAEAARKLAQGTFGEYLELLAIPNDAVNASDIRKNAAWLERAFAKRGFEAKQLENNGRPMLFAEWPKKKDGAKTVLFYLHMDGQPVVNVQWSQPNPWQPVVKKKNAAGKWEIANPGALFSEELDPELRVFARSAADDKGPIMMLLAAFDGLAKAKAEPAINVKVLIDGEEEKGSPSLPALAAANQALLRADAIVVHAPVLLAPLEPLAEWVHVAQQRLHPAAAPAPLRMAGGAPIDRLAGLLGAPFIVVPLANPDSNQHAFDENMRVGHYVDGIRVLNELLRSAY